MTPATLTPRARAELADRVARARLAKTPPPPPPDETVAQLERANHTLRLTIDHLKQQLNDARRQLCHTDNQLDQERANAAHYKRVAEAKGHRPWLEAERQIVMLRQRIRELEATT